MLHNAVERDDGRWVWRYQRPRLAEGDPIGEMPDFPSLWDDVDKITAPLMLVRGGDSAVVDDGDVDELRRRQPDVRVETVAGSGHSIQGDRPVELARLLADFLEQ